jgi:hypothetical protein
MSSTPTDKRTESKAGKAVESALKDVENTLNKQRTGGYSPDIPFPMSDGKDVSFNTEAQIVNHMSQLIDQTISDETENARLKQKVKQRIKAAFTGF